MGECSQRERIDELVNLNKKMIKILNGNGEVGLVAQVKNNAEWIKTQKKFRLGIVTFVVRSVIIGTLGYIAYLLKLLLIKLGANLPF